MSPKPKEPCLVEDCDLPEYSLAYCQKHYTRLWRYGDPEHYRYTPSQYDLKEHFEYVGWTVDEWGCWLWNGGCSDNGYGSLTHRRKNYKTHRLSYEIYIGPIPKGRLIRHKCEVKRCINPKHLEPGTYQDNMNDRFRSDRGMAFLLTLRDMESE